MINFIPCIRVLIVCMGLEAFYTITYGNYGEVGLGFDNGKHASAINAHWSVWQPKLRAWITKGFGHYSVHCLPLLTFAQHGKGVLEVYRGNISFGFCNIV